MKNQVARTYVLLGIALILYVCAEYVVKPGELRNFLTGGAAGLALGGCVSFVLMLIQTYKQKKA
ncbi:hypothetical protein [Mucilaginibacter phyllosphaerae]